MMDTGFSWIGSKIIALRWTKPDLEMQECYLHNFRVGYIHRPTSGRSARKQWAGFVLSNRVNDAVIWTEDDTEARKAVESGAREAMGFGHA